MAYQGGWGFKSLFFVVKLPAVCNFSTFTAMSQKKCDMKGGFDANLNINITETIQFGCELNLFEQLPNSLKDLLYEMKTRESLNIAQHSSLRGFCL